MINAIRAHLAEFAIVAAVSRYGVEELLDVVADPNDDRVPEAARQCLTDLGAQLRMLKAQAWNSIAASWRRRRSNETSKRLDELPGVGLALATARWPALPIQRLFDQRRDFSALVGLVLKQNSSVARRSSARITACDTCAALFTAGALAVIR